ncbi:peptidase S28 [Lentinula guzmanii]|uniref:Peptidase S28 n=1 Tax=Lentinula guzmanii TaxID=2804957 RepID=A0AA38N2K4_9AGAR|nr:peptidase S28 [Lentinula guzmanii]
MLLLPSMLGSLALCMEIAVALRPNGILDRAAPIAPIPEDALSEGPVVSRNGTQLPPYNTTYIFNQLIDHNNPSLGTFQQRYWHTYEWYETAYTGYLTNVTINGQIAQQQSGATIVLEHRFYGLSNPVPNLSGKNLKLHTIQQAIDDLEYFANTVVLPMPNGANLSPATAPWVLVGGSYSGALTSWTMVNKPDVFWAGYASSAVVEAILDYWGYFEPIRQFMPANCSADVEAVIAHVDEVFSGNDTTAIQVLKDNWGLGEMTHLDDVAGFRNNLWDWQSLSPTSGPGATFFDFCDALEVKNGVNAPASGWGLDHALTAWGSFWNETYLDFLCGGDDVVDCLGSYNPDSAVYTDIALDNAGRSWTWIVCNEVGFLQEGPPEDVPAIVTRLVQPPYDIRQCVLMFPDVFASSADVPMAAGVATVDKVYTGWNVSIDRLFFANGQRDPWREATVSADGVDVPSTDTQPIAIGDGFHCSDLSTASGNVDPTVRAVQTKALAFMKTWLAEWTPPSKSSKRDVPRARSSRLFRDGVA